MTVIYRSAWRWRCAQCGSRRWVKTGRRRFYCAACGWEWLPGRKPMDGGRVEQIKLQEVGE